MNRTELTELDAMLERTDRVIGNTHARVATLMDSKKEPSGDN